MFGFLDCGLRGAAGDADAWAPSTRASIPTSTSRPRLAASRSDRTKRQPDRAAERGTERAGRAGAGAAPTTDPLLLKKKIAAKHAERHAEGDRGISSVDLDHRTSVYV